MAFKDGAIYRSYMAFSDLAYPTEPATGEPTAGNIIANLTTKDWLTMGGIILLGYLIYQATKEDTDDDDDDDDDDTPEQPSKPDYRSDTRALRLYEDGRIKVGLL